MSDTASSPEIDRQAADWFLWLVEEPEDAELRARFERWLAGDPAHARAWNRISRVGTGLSTASPPSSLSPLPSPRPSRTRPARLTGARAAEVRRPARRWALAAAIAVLLLLPAWSNLALYLRADHLTGTATTRTIALGDGSLVRLAPKSAVAIDGTDRRSVRLLAGRAWFDVRHDAQHPFRVTAGDVTALDLGTAFEVERSATGARIAVSHGKVAVNVAGQPAASRTLGPGDWLGIADHRVAGEGRAVPDLMGPWRDGKLMLDNRPIADAIADIRPWYRGRIVVLNKDLAIRRVTGIYDLRDPVAALESLVYPAGGKVTRVTPWLMIVTLR